MMTLIWIEKKIKKKYIEYVKIETSSMKPKISLLKKLEKPYLWFQIGPVNSSL